MHGGISRSHEIPLKPNLEVELFDVWGINIMVPFVSSYGKKYILVEVDYVYRWVEAMELPNNESKCVTSFLKKNIFTRFGMPHAIISDGDIYFCNWVFRALLDKYRVKNKLVTPYNP